MVACASSDPVAMPMLPKRGIAPPEAFLFSSVTAPRRMYCTPATRPSSAAVLASTSPDCPSRISLPTLSS